MYYFLLVIYCNKLSILHCFLDITTLTMCETACPWQVLQFRWENGHCRSRTLSDSCV